MGRDSSLSRGHGLGAVRTLAQFRDFADDQPALSAADRMLLVRQAQILVENLYVHLPLKAAMHAVDPVQRLRLLAFRAPTLTDREFHAELLDIFLSLRDLHTNYSLPEPYSSRIAFEVARLLDAEFPPEGLIVDVRGNGGGCIIAAEVRLQL